MADYYTLLTTIGAAQLANAQALGTTVQIAQVAVGDGGGAGYDPDESQDELVNEVWRGNINQTYVHADNANWVVIEAVIPEEVGGWFVREVGLIDAGGNLIAIGKYPETYKPALASGSAKDLYIRFILEISNTADVVLKIDPAIVLASRSWVTNMLAAHALDPAAHGLLNTYDIPFMAGWGGDGEGEDVAEQTYGAVVLTRNVAFVGETLRAETSPTGAALIVDVKVNGDSLYTTQPEIAAGADAGTPGVLDPAMVNASAGDLVTFEIDQIGTEDTGRQITFTVKAKVRN